MRGLALLAAAVLLVGCRETVFEASFVVPPGAAYTWTVTVLEVSTLSASWASVGAPDGSLGDLDVTLIGPDVSESWPRSISSSVALDVGPGEYTFSFGNGFSPVTSKEVSISVTLTPR